jgi:UPF0755 protein
MLKPKYWKLTLLLIPLVLMTTIPAYVWWSFIRPGPLLQGTTILIKKGTTIDQATDILYGKGIIRNKSIFKFRFRQGRLKIIRGEYLFSPASSMADVTEKLTKGIIHITKLVITPSLHGWSLQKRLEPFIPEEVFWSLWTDPKYTKMAGFPDAPSLEGLIAPATYSLNRAMEPEEIITEMVQAFHSQVFPTLEGGVLPPYQTLILASLAEKETNIHDELSHVTGVFKNRLNIHMRLQCDPTSLYARWMSGDLRFTPPTSDDINRSHPYNTYSTMGLPPSPIAIPSKAAIEAAKKPLETDAFYFVATGTGGHNFSKTLKEHNQNVNTYREEVNRQRRARQTTAPDSVPVVGK